MYRPESLIIDNDKLRLFDELNNILKEQKSLDVASAYFNIAGFQLIKDSLSGAEKFRLLIGTSPQVDEKKPDIFQPEELYQKKLREDLEEEIFERDKKWSCHLAWMFIITSDGGRGHFVSRKEKNGKHLFYQH